MDPSTVATCLAPLKPKFESLGVKRLLLVGSVARGQATPESDVDLLIDLSDDRGAADYLALAEELEALLGRRVDLVIDRSLSPHFRPFIEAEARPL